MSVIQTNSAANSAYRNLSMTSSMLERQITKLSSGFRINRSADDAAGLAIANKLRAESRSLQQAFGDGARRRPARVPGRCEGRRHKTQ